MSVPVLKVSGSPYEMGLAHGKAMAEQIAAYAAERVQLAGERGWTGREASSEEVLALAAACGKRHQEYSPGLYEELEGVAAGSGVSVPALIVAGGFTDFVDVVASSRGVEDGLDASGARGGAADGDAAREAAAAPAGAGARAPLEHETDDCTAFLVPGARLRDGGGALAQTWDMHESSAEHLVLLQGRPDHAPDFVVYTTAGCLGMIGMNEAGLCVGINNLLSADGRVGVTWPFAVRALLEQETAAAALELLLATPLAGGHNYLIIDADGEGANVEAMATRHHVTRLGSDPLVHANHCLHPATRAVERAREASSQANSEARQADGERLLDRYDLTVADLQAATADQASICRVGEAPLFVGTCGAVVMLPAQRELWVVGGRPSEGRYERYAFGPVPA